jgi:SulP family sulfate permease
MSVAVLLFGINVEKVTLGASLSSVADVTAMFSAHLPTHLPTGLIWPAFQFALQLAMLAYLDTLLTSLVVDKKVQLMFNSKETTAQSKELAAQGVANAAVATFGGIPGAQATIRSVLILNEGAVTRLAGVMVGLFVLVEMILFQDLISAIPKAVFTGVLIKVGYDVFDWQPLILYWNEIKQGKVPDAAHPTGRPMVTHLNMLFIAGTTIVTVLVDLNVAVVSFCVLFYVIGAFRPIHDLIQDSETEGFADED